MTTDLRTPPAIPSVPVRGLTARFPFNHLCLDMTRRNLKWHARDKGRPWDWGKNVHDAAVCSESDHLPSAVMEPLELSLSANGQIKLRSNVDKLSWNIRKTIADLSLFPHLQPGDLMYTDTPEGVGPVVSVDVIDRQIEGAGSNQLQVATAA